MRKFPKLADHLGWQQNCLGSKMDANSDRFATAMDCEADSFTELATSENSAPQHIQLHLSQTIDDLAGLLSEDVLAEPLPTFRSREKQQVSCADAFCLYSAIIHDSNGYKEHFGDNGRHPWEAIHIWCAKLFAMDAAAAYVTAHRDLKAFKNKFTELFARVQRQCMSRPKGTSPQEFLDAVLASSEMQQPFNAIKANMLACLKKHRLQPQYTGAYYLPHHSAGLCHVMDVCCVRRERIPTGPGHR